MKIKKRVRQDNYIGVRLTAELRSVVLKLAKHNKVKESEIVRYALEQLIEKKSQSC